MKKFYETELGSDYNAESRSALSLPALCHETRGLATYADWEATMQAPAFCIFCHYAKKRACCHARPADSTPEPAVVPAEATTPNEAGARSETSGADVAVMH